MNVQGRALVGNIIHTSRMAYLEIAMNDGRALAVKVKQPIDDIGAETQTIVDREGSGIALNVLKQVAVGHILHDLMRNRPREHKYSMIRRCDTRHSHGKYASSCV